VADDKVLENLLRRRAMRRGMRLEKSRQRDPRGLIYGRYRLVDVPTSSMVVHDPIGQGYPLADLDDVKKALDAMDE
jgi:hypothetical protein